MGVFMQGNNINEIHSEVITLFARKKLTITNVKTVDYFSDKVLKLSVLGKTLTVTGSDIKITSFTQTTGQFSADGNFISISFDGEKTPFLKRIFK